ncbi:unnamed protein product [Parajaminaea phylloscopi]
MIPPDTSSLPGPFLELSIANLGYNELNVDQLAALWHVFTKVGDSLHKGRRLENFVWRAWHREAHLLPPDATWSDFADSTPLETPALSRSGSVCHSFPRKPSLSHALSMAQLPATLADSANEPSDPEEGASWSSEDESEDEQSQTRPQSGVPGRSQSKNIAPAPRVETTPSGQPRGRTSILTSTPAPAPSKVATPDPRNTETSAHASASHVGDRKRATSSSSAFGSRARVRYLNLRKPNKRRPISFQAALRSLTSSTDSDDLAALAREHRSQGAEAGAVRRSFQGPVPIAASAQPGGEDMSAELVPASHSSAPAATKSLSDATELGGSADKAAISPKPAESQSVAPPSEAGPDPATDVEHSRTDAVQHAQLPVPPVDVQRRSPSPRPPPTSLLKQPAGETTAGQKSKKKPSFFLSTSAGKSLDEDEGEAPIEHVADVSNKGGVPAPTIPSPGLTAQDSQRAAAAQGTAAAAPKETSRKNDPPAPPTNGLTGGQRQRSSGHLPKAGKGKIGHRQGSSGRLTALHGLTMTRAQPAAAPAAPAVKATGRAAAPDEGRKRPGRKGAPSRPVKFALGGDEEEHHSSDEYTDEESVEPAKTVATTSQEKKAVDAVQSDDDDDAWSSDASAEAEEQRRKAKEAADRKRKFEMERQHDMFKKVPIRSQSAADVRHLIENDGPEAEPAPTRPQGEAIEAQHHPRGLLSSLFHPDEQPSFPPGQLHGRPHASAADLRHAVQQDSLRPEHAHGDSRHKGEKSARAHSRERPSHHRRPPSLISGTPANTAENGGPLRASKSAVALPVLNVAGSGGTAGQGSAEEQPFESGSLIQQSAESQSTHTGRASDREAPPTRRPRDGSTSSAGSASGRPEPLTAPAVAAHRNSLPAPIAPQTPRTTRRNMLRDELSESLRQNLLWERQSRNRMLGIGANGPREATTGANSQAQAPAAAPQAPPRPQRRETVLGGNTLRPLTRGPGPGIPTTGTSGGPGHSRGGHATSEAHALATHDTHSKSTPSLPLLDAAATQRPKERRHNTISQLPELSSNETTDDEDADSARPEARTAQQGHAGEGDHGRHHSEENRSGAAGKKKVMWPGGFPNYHQHGW